MVVLGPGHVVRRIDPEARVAGNEGRRNLSSRGAGLATLLLRRFRHCFHWRTRELGHARRIARHDLLKRDAILGEIDPRRLGAERRGGEDHGEADADFDFREANQADLPIRIAGAFADRTDEEIVGGSQQQQTAQKNHFRDDHDAVRGAVEGAPRSDEPEAEAEAGKKQNQNADLGKAGEPCADRSENLQIVNILHDQHQRDHTADPCRGCEIVDRGDRDESKAILHAGGSMAGHNNGRDHSGRRNEGKEADPAEQTSRPEEQDKARGDPQKPSDDEIGAQNVANGEVGGGGENSNIDGDEEELGNGKTQRAPANHPPGGPKPSRLSKLRGAHDDKKKNNPAHRDSLATENRRTKKNGKKAKFAEKSS